MTHWALRVLLVLALGLGWGVRIALANPSGELAAQKAQVAKEQSALRERIRQLQRQIDERESARKEAADALKVSETAISAANRRINEYSVQLSQAETALQDLQTKTLKQQDVLAQRRKELAAQLRTQYQSGLSPWTALLSGDDPQRLGRELGYLDYVSRARADAVSNLRRDITRLAELEKRTEDRRQDIARIVRETTEQKQELENQKKQRATVLARLEGQLQAQRGEADKLSRDEKRLSGLIADLDEQVAAARRAAEAARKAEEARRAEQARLAAQAKKEEEARRAEQARLAAQAAREAQEALRRAEIDKQAQVRQQAQLAAEQASQAKMEAQEAARAARLAESERQRIESQPSQPNTFSSSGLKPGLRWPVKGEVMARFGTDRPEGGMWRGVLLKSAEGTPVRVVSGGTVVYANWLRGFGNLLIVDHGQQYLSVYAYNQSLLKQVGDQVKAQETVALAGNTGGQLDSALYFEIRHRGAAVDPMQYLAK